MQNPNLNGANRVRFGSNRSRPRRDRDFFWPGGTALTLRIITALRFQDLAVGDTWESAGRTITEADVAIFAGLSGDYNPLHVNYEAARATPFGRPIAHGLLGLAVASGLASHAPRVETLAFLGIRDWRFHEPIFFGDTIRVITRVEALEARARGRRGRVTWHRRLVNQHGKTVQEGWIDTLVRGHDPAGTPPEAHESDGPDLT
jgi:3-hydroxybutyryl-CoA dehydratase